MKAKITPVFQGAARSRRLFVLIPDYTGKPRRIVGVASAIREREPLSDVAITGYSGGVFSNNDPLEIAELIVEEIDARVKAKAAAGDRYDGIVLVGYSLGAIIARLVYLLASGRTRSTTCDRPVPVAWAGQVDRIVLLAGITRGWSGHIERPPHTPLLMYWSLLVALRLARVFRFGMLLRSGLAGSPTVANLRLEWMDAVHDGDAKTPTVVQLIGDADPFASPSDHIDLFGGSAFVYRKLPKGTNHFTAVDFEGPNGPMRKVAILEALFAPIATLRSQVTFDERPTIDPNVRHVVFVMHGIRDRGREWQPALAKAIEDAGGEGMQTIVSDYGYMPMLKFLLVSERRKRVRWFMDRYIEARAKYPNADISYVGHSNGTYVLAESLRTYHTCRVKYVVFAGSVVRTDFPWNRFMDEKRVLSVRNFAGARDWIVAVFPGLFEKLNLDPDLGAAGFHGFSAESVQPHQVCYLDGGHSVALEPTNFASIAAFVVSGNPVGPGVRTSARPHGGVDRLGKYPELCWIGAAALLIAPGFLIWKQLAPLGPVTAVLGVAAYAGLVGLVLLRE